MSTPNIYARLAAINKDIKAISKNQLNQSQKFKFRGIDDVMNELHGIFAKNEVFIVPEVLTHSTSERTTAKDTKILSTYATIKYTFYAPDGTSVSSQVVGEAMDTGDKGMNKAMSIALKYCLLQMFLIPTEEQKDPDFFSYEVCTPQPAPLNSSLQQALEDARRCRTKNELEESWNRNPTLHSNSEYCKVITSLKNQLLNK